MATDVFKKSFHTNLLNRIGQTALMVKARSKCRRPDQGRENDQAAGAAGHGGGCGIHCRNSLQHFESLFHVICELQEADFFASFFGDFRRVNGWHIACYWLPLMLLLTWTFHSGFSMRGY